MEIFSCEDQGPMKEYIGNKVEYDMNRKFMKITQPVLVQSLSDEFQVNLEHSVVTPVVTPGVPGQVLTKGQADVGPGEQYIFRKGARPILLRGIYSYGTNSEINYKNSTSTKPTWKVA
jgi:hypothetical protein